MSQALICPNCSTALPLRDGKPTKFCTRCGNRVAAAPNTAPITMSRPAMAVAATVPLADSQITVSPESSTTIEARHWNWGAFLLAPWWALAHRAYLTAAIYLVLDGALWFFSLLGASGGIKRDGFAESDLYLLLTVVAVVFLVTTLLAVPLALFGDKVALKHRTFADAGEFRNLQRIWARWGATFGVAVVLPPALTTGYFLVTVPHTPGGLNSRLLAASAQGNATEVRIVLTEYRERYGVYGNLQLENAIVNAQYSGNAEAVKLLQAAVAQRRQGEMTNQ